MIVVHSRHITSYRCTELCHYLINEKLSLEHIWAQKISVVSIIHVPIILSAFTHSVYRI